MPERNHFQPDNSVSTELSAERSERRDKRMTEVMLRRHNNAVIGVKVERILFQSIDELSSEEEASSLIDRMHAFAEGFDLPKDDSYPYRSANFRTNYTGTLLEYDRLRASAVKSEGELRRLVLKSGEEFTPETLAEYVFISYTGQKNEGTIAITRKEGYFILTFEDPKDFLAFCYKDETTPKLVPVASYIPKVKVGKSALNIIAMNGEGESETARDTFIHERRHFLNNSLGQIDFEKESEKPSKDFPGLSQHEEREHIWAIKDELFARIAEVNISEDDITNFLQKWDPKFSEKAYQYLLQHFSEEEQKELLILMDSIKIAIRPLLRLFRTEEERTFLVYCLLDIPLLQIPKWLKAIEEYYANPIEELRSYLPVLDYMKGRKLPPGQLQRLEEVVQQISDVIFDVVPLINGISASTSDRKGLVEKTKGELEILKAKYDILHEELMPV
jgi:hypothetical protein